MQAANLAANGLVAPSDLARRVSIALTTLVRHTTANTPQELIRQLLSHLHRLPTAHPPTAARAPRPG